MSNDDNKTIKAENCTDIQVQEIIAEFKECLNEKNHRYLSFDYCYYYFQTNGSCLTDSDHMEKSCMMLWSFLSSWGMLRKSKLMQYNYSALKPVIEIIQKYLGSKKDIPDVKEESEKEDSKEYCEKVVRLYNDISDSIKVKYFKPTDTLVTKIILGVFGAFPALDRNFRKVFGQGKIETIADKVWNFYKDHKDVLKEKISVQNFNGVTDLEYPAAKLIDMFGFTAGMKIKP